MSTYAEARDNLAAALGPVASYLQRADSSSHANRIAALVEAVVDFGEAAEETIDNSREGWLIRFALHLASRPKQPVDPLIARVKRHLNQPHMLARAALPLEERKALASITSHHLPPHGQSL